MTSSCRRPVAAATGGLALALSLGACAAATGGGPSPAPAAPEPVPTAAVIAPAPAMAPAGMSADEVFASASRYVWTLGAFRLGPDGRTLTPVGRGSAVAVSPDTLLTSCQNLQGADAAGLQRKGGAPQRATFRGPAPQEGVCVLKVPAPVADYARTRLYDDVRPFEKAYTIDSSASLDPTFGEGTVSGKQVTSHGAIIGTTAPVPRDTAGGGLFDADGVLIGITSALVRGGETLNAASAITPDLVAPAAPVAAAAPVAPTPAPALPSGVGGGDPLGTLLDEQASRLRDDPGAAPPAAP